MDFENTFVFLKSVNFIKFNWYLYFQQFFLSNRYPQLNLAKLLINQSPRKFILSISAFKKDEIGCDPYQQVEILITKEFILSIFVLCLSKKSPFLKMCSTRFFLSRIQKILRPCQFANYSHVPEYNITAAITNAPE